MRICTVTGNKEKGVKIMPRPYLGDPKYTIEVLQKYNFAFQKRFGQNFLIDTHVLDKIIDSAQITKDDFVLEIGPNFFWNTKLYFCNTSIVYKSIFQK